MITQIIKSNQDTSELMNIKSFRYLSVDNIKNPLYQYISTTFGIWVGVSGGFYYIINSRLKDDITMEIRRLLVNMYYKNPVTIMSLEYWND